jgi:hypothetical protein
MPTHLDALSLSHMAAADFSARSFGVMISVL